MAVICQAEDLEVRARALVLDFTADTSRTSAARPALHPRGAWSKPMWPAVESSVLEGNPGTEKFAKSRDAFGPSSPYGQLWAQVGLKEGNEKGSRDVG